MISSSLQTQRPVRKLHTLVARSAPITTILIIVLVGVVSGARILVCWGGERIAFSWLCDGRAIAMFFMTLLAFLVLAAVIFSAEHHTTEPIEDLAKWSTWINRPHRVIWLGFRTLGISGTPHRKKTLFSGIAWIVFLIFIVWLLYFSNIAFG